jgi:hypothetical protein
MATPKIWQLIRHNGPIFSAAVPPQPSFDNGEVGYWLRADPRMPAKPVATVSNRIAFGAATNTTSVGERQRRNPEANVGR